MRSQAQGFSLVELLIGMSITLVVTGAALSLALSSRTLYEADQARTRLVQNLRASRDFLTADVQHAGERLGPGFPVLEIVNGASGAPDQLIVRRNLLDTTLNVCWDLAGVQNWIIIGLDASLSPPPGCFQMAGAENLNAWSAYRTANGDADDGSAVSTDVRAFIYNPTTGDGQFFNYTMEIDSTNFDLVMATPPSGGWTGCVVADGCQLYLLEERRYQVSGDLLQLVRNRDTANPINLVDSLTDFQLRALFQPDPPNPTPPPQETLDWTDDWSTLRAVEVTIAGAASYRDRTLTDGWTTEILPRNVLSR